MYNQDEYIFEEFKKNFATIECEPIVIYGIGISTGELLKRIPHYNIVGFMDGKRKSGTIWDKPILDTEDVLRLGVKNIIILARPAVIGMIYYRIKDFTLKNDIKVTDIHGTNLAVKYQNRVFDLPYYQKNWNDIEKACEKHNIVSFDIFDTLLIRKTLYPKDIFELVERELEDTDNKISHFAKFRMKAEHLLYKRSLNPNIYQIYDELKIITNSDKKTIDKYLEMEIKTELKFIAPRQSMLLFFNKLKKNKTIYLISDMYLTKDILKKMLSKCGYEGYKDIYVSCEYNCSKTEGLFDVFISEDKDRQNCIHIGDNPIADGKCAQAAGIETFEIMSMREMLENSAYRCLIDKSTGLFDDLIIGLFCCKALDDPFVFYDKRGKLVLENHKDISYLCCAPIICCFSVWFMQKIKQTDCEYLVYPSRDAYILQKVCEIICNNQYIKKFPDGVYFYTSRRAIFASTVFEKKDIEKVAYGEFHGTIYDLFKERFDVAIREDTDLKSDKQNIQNCIDKYAEEIVHKCKKERDSYLKYIDSVKVSEKEKLAFIDFVAAGSVQNGLRKLLTKQIIKGYYFLKRKTNDFELEKCIDVESFYPPQGDFELDANIYKYYLFLELLLTSQEPTFHSIRSDGTPRFMDEVRTDIHIRTIADMQNAVLDYCKEISYLYPKMITEYINRDIPDQMIGFLGKEYTKITSEKVLSLVLTDEYLSMKFNIFDR